MDDDASGKAEGAQSIRRAVAILSVLAAGQEAGVRLTDITERTGLSRPTCHRILKVLIEENIVEQNPSTRRYAIGEQIPMLALARVGRTPFLRAAETELRRISAEIGDTMFLTVRTGLDTLCVARRLGVFPIQVLMVDVGQRRPLGMSSAGLAMLARLQEGESEEILAQNEVRLRRLGLSLPRVRELVATTQRRGHVIREHGLIPGTKVVSVALEAPGGKSLAAFTAAGIDRRMSQQRTAEVAARLKESVARIETMLPR